MQGATFLFLAVFQARKTLEVRNVGGYVSYFGGFPCLQNP